MTAATSDTVERRRLRQWLRRPPTHWFVLAVALVVLVLMLATAAVLDGDGDVVPVGGSGLRSPRTTGPVIDLSGPTLRSGHGDGSAVGLALVGLPDRPSERRMLAALDERGATATWFLSGEDVVWSAGAVDRLHRVAGEIGVTGYSGRDLRGERPWRLRLELSVAQAALAARMDLTSHLLVLPSTPVRHALDRRALRAAGEAGDQGYLLVAGTEAHAAEPGDVVVIRAEDRGPAAALELEQLLAEADQRGLPVRTVSAAVGLDPGRTNSPADRITQGNAWLVVAAVVASEAVSTALPILFFPITALVAVRALLTVAFGVAHARRRRQPEGWTGPVAVVVPAYNEAAGIEATVRSLASSTWEHGLEIIVVDDGSTDGTADIAESLDLAGLTVIRQANTGKPGALNTGVAASTADVVVLLDGDTIFQPDTIGELVRRFDDPAVGAVSGNAKVANRSTLLGRWQHIEYVMGFNLDRRMLDTLHAIATVPGAVGAFRRQALREVGGVSDDTIAEDTDLTIALNRAGWTVTYEPSAIAWTEAPSTVGDLWRQRYRWSYGVLQSVWKHRRALLERHPIGPVGIPYTLIFQVLVGLVAPVVDVAALFALLTGAQSVLWAWLGFTLLQVAMAAVAFRLDGESLRPLWAVPLQQVFYRQLMYLVVIQAAASAAAGARLRWHKLHRVGIGELQEAS